MELTGVLTLWSGCMQSELLGSCVGLGTQLAAVNFSYLVVTRLAF